MGSTAFLSPRGSAAAQAWISPSEKADLGAPSLPSVLPVSVGSCAFPITLTRVGAVVTLCWGLWKHERCPRRSRHLPGIVPASPVLSHPARPSRRGWRSHSCHLPSRHLPGWDTSPVGLTGSSLCRGMAEPCPGSTWSFSCWDQAPP